MEGCRHPGPVGVLPPAWTASQVSATRGPGGGRSALCPLSPGPLVIRCRPQNCSLTSDSQASDSGSKPGCWGEWGWRTTGRQCREPDGVHAGSQSGTHPKGTWLRRPYQGVPSSVSMTKSRNTTVVQLVCGRYLHTPTFAVLGQCRHIPGHQEKD